MSYYVIKKIEDDKYWYTLPPYEGKCTFYNDLLWYATSLALPTEFESKSEAQSAIEASKKIFKNAKFRLEEVIEDAA